MQNLFQAMLRYIVLNYWWLHSTSLVGQLVVLINVVMLDTGVTYATVYVYRKLLCDAENEFCAKQEIIHEARVCHGRQITWLQPMTNSS